MGFEHNVTYKISSVFDGSVLDLSGNNSKKGSKIITWDWTDGDNQKWKTSLEGESGFRLDSILPAKGNEFVPVIDGSKDTIVLGSFSGQLNQVWIVTEVPDGSGAVFIENVENGRCLRNMGHGTQVKSVAKSDEDRSAWWLLIPV